MRTGTALLLAWLLLLGSTGAVAAPISEIAFEGNELTQSKVLLRELVVHVGDEANPQRIETSRQALLDLGLFKHVSVREEVAADGGVRLVFKVDERYYLLPTPSFDAKSDGRYSYGALLRGHNLWGLNHSIRLQWEEQDRQRQGIGKERSVSASYYAPFVADSAYNLGVSSSYTTRPREIAGGTYAEEFRRLSVTGSRTYGDGPASQGWTLGSGLRWQQQRTAGVLAPLAYGEALAPLVFANYRDFHYRVYSETGSTYNASYEIAHDGWASDYSYSRLGLGAARYLDVGSTAHQTLHLSANTGWSFSGPDGVRQYGLGGASLLRGYDANFIEGNAYWYATAELARPLWKPWLRVVAMVEAGNVYATPEDANFDRVHASVGLGLRLRLTSFVNFEVEAGVALPLDGGGARFFASRV